MDTVYCIRFHQLSEVKIGYSRSHSIHERLKVLEKKHGSFEILCLLWTEFDVRATSCRKTPLELWLHKYFDSQRVFGNGKGGSQRPERFRLTDAELANGIERARNFCNFIECWYLPTLQ